MGKEVKGKGETVMGNVVQVIRKGKVKEKIGEGLTVGVKGSG